jgi:hypothetical protein
MTRRLLLITLLLLSSGPAYAEWVSVGTDDKLTLYVDPDTIRRKGDLVKMWSLLDYKTIQTSSGGSYLSTKQQSEYDCTDERERLIVFAAFSGSMGSGKVVFLNQTEDKWVPVAPDSSGQAMWKFACAKK